MVIHLEECSQEIQYFQKRIHAAIKDPAYSLTDRKCRLVKSCHFITSVCFNRSERMTTGVRQTTTEVLGSEELHVSGKSDIGLGHTAGMKLIIMSQIGTC